MRGSQQEEEEEEKEEEKEEEEEMKRKRRGTVASFVLRSYNDNVTIYRNYSRRQAADN